MKKANADIRDELEKRRIRQFEVAGQLGITEFTFCRWMRTEFSPERKVKVKAAIEQLTEKIYKES